MEKSVRFVKSVWENNPITLIYGIIRVSGMQTE